MNLKDRYAIVGIGYTPQGRIPERTALSFYTESCANAIMDAGLERKDIDGLMCYRQFPQQPGEEEVTPYLVAQLLGLSPNVLKWANLNPQAIMYDHPMTYDDYYDSKWVIDPLRLVDCCLINDGGRACVITSLERARDLKNPPVVIMGLGQHNPSCDIRQSTSMDGPTGARIAGRKAFEMADVTPGDIDACQIYDCFTYTVEITLQDYGFFAPGEGQDWFKDGRSAPGGELPINTSGGQLSEAYFMGLTPLTEAVMQLMGRCGRRQLGPKTATKSPEIILCSDNGGILQTHTSVILRGL